MDLAAPEPFKGSGKTSGLLQLANDCLGNIFRTGGVLTSDQLAIFNQKRCPVRSFLVVPAKALKIVFNEKQHDISDVQQQLPHRL